VSLIVKDSSIQGKGVFTTDHIPRHSVIGRINIVREVTEERPLDPSRGELEHHCHWYPDGTTVLVGEPHCYLNHSCESNTFLYTVNRVSYLIAMREIQEDEELTLDYSLCNFAGKDFDCKCGSPDCRGLHKCGFGFMDKSRQAKYLPYLDPFIVQCNSESMQEILERQL
jgi:SET domain-containing protein